MNSYKKIEIENGHTLTIHHDESCDQLDEIFDQVTFISNHRNYNNKGPEKELTLERILSKKKLPRRLKAVAVHAYIHSGIALSLSNDLYPFNCRWDSGVFGFLVFKDGEFGENDQGLKGFIKSWNDLLEGNVYGYTLEDESGQELSSCWGFYGYESDKDMIESMLEDCDIEDGLKQQIKEAV